MAKRNKGTKSPAQTPALEPAASTAADTTSRSHPSGVELAALTAIGVASALWALFQWGQLLVARAGGKTFCSIDNTLDCQAVWNSSFASGIHSATGLPVAGWGLVWGLVATVLPLWALANKGDGRKLGALWAATIATAGAGVITVAIMAIASLQGGKLCPTCLVTYALVIGYAFLAWRRWGRSHIKPWDQRALTRAGAVTVVAYLVLLVPGLRTPSAADNAGLDALQAEAKRKQDAAANTPSQPQGPAHASADDEVSAFLASLSPDVQQGVSDALAILRSSPAVPMRKARAIVGSPAAPVHITDFTDIMCGHCAELHRVLEQIKSMLPPDALSIEARHFPLDGGCNSAVQSPPRFPVRCLAAKAQICLEGHPDAFEFSGKLFKNNQQLSEGMIYELAAPYMGKEQLAECIGSPGTAIKLAEDIEWAVAHELEGTPLVLVNGKKAAGFAPFLYAVALAGGNIDHPAFQRLPAANPHAHMH